MKKTGVVLSYLAMIIMNALANLLPINGQNTGAISDAYPNLFTPAGYTFSIWGLIYLLLGIQLIFLLRQPKFYNNPLKNQGMSRIMTLFIVSSIANATWILAWHYRFIGVSVLIMVVILVSLILMMNEVMKTPFSKSEILWIKPPVGVYLGWITVATVANVTVYLVSIQWSRFGVSEEICMVTILIIAALIACATMMWSKCGAYGLTVIWAYVGILSKHTSATGFDYEYGRVILTLYIALALLILVTGSIIWVQIKKN
ncbi:TspO/MBR family protein [Fusibacter ferrireducens]|uniref:Tryptophan-rich sensory protein n=1 Tax=Fusibacter ferrireducens TaxID=2785058 RepID=A0ABR9ZUX9_9FIRM|nr:TspO/MBR family protein [Fusibacter ferrireducens]MBF4694238.1 tryptophan-rich sensory protein [Fusibacter ferrireducens]